MATLGERIAAVESDVREQQVRTGGMKEEIANLRLDMNARFEAIDRRFDGVDRRFESIDRRFDLLDAKMSRQFVWLVGVQVMTLAAVVTSLATILSAVAGR